MTIIFQKKMSIENDRYTKLKLCPNNEGVRGGGTTTKSTEFTINQTKVGISA
jgi:hypothetical protein